jgi:DNA repair exonuclease SbcCD ATPase subunit
MAAHLAKDYSVTQEHCSNMSTMEEESNRKMASIMSDNKELKENLRDAKLACQDLEEERRFHAAKATELQESLQAVGSDDDVAARLVEKSLEIAELSMEVDAMKFQLREVSKERYLMDQEREANVEMMAELSKVIRGQKQQLDAKGESQSSLNVADPDYDLKQLKIQLQTMEKERNGITKKCESLQRTVETLKQKNCEREVKSLISLRHMRLQIDDFLDERKRRTESLSSLEQKIETLEEESEAKDEKIFALEQQFHLFDSRRMDGSHSEVTKLGGKSLKVKRAPRKSKVLLEHEARDDSASSKKYDLVLHLRDKEFRLGAIKSGSGNPERAEDDCDNSTYTDSTVSHTGSDILSSSGEVVVTRLAI